MAGKKKTHVFLSYDEARDFVIKSGIKTNNEWLVACKAGKIPDNIPHNPSSHYQRYGSWINYGHWFGTNVESNVNKKFLPYDEAKIICSKIGLRSKKYWIKYISENGCIDSIPHNPKQHYTRFDTWISWDDFLGYEPLGNKFKRAVYSYVFPDNSIYFGLSYNIPERNQDHGVNKSSMVYQHIQKTNLQPKITMLSDGYINAVEAQNLEKRLIREYRKDALWNVLNIHEGGGLGHNSTSRTPEEIQRIVSKYEYCKEFRGKELALYDYLRKTKQTDIYCSHMKKVRGDVWAGKRKKVYQYSKDKTIFIKEWESLSEASSTLNMNDECIRRVLVGQGKTSYEYFWSYTKLV